MYTKPPKIALTYPRKNTYTLKTTFRRLYWLLCTGILTGRKIEKRVQYFLTCVFCILAVCVLRTHTHTHRHRGRSCGSLLRHKQRRSFRIHMSRRSSSLTGYQLRGREHVCQTSMLQEFAKGPHELYCSIHPEHPCLVSKLFVISLRHFQSVLKKNVSLYCLNVFGASRRKSKVIFLFFMDDCT